MLLLRTSLAQQRRDAIKKEQCDDEWVVLLEIWPEDNIRDFLSEELYYLGVI